MPQPLPQPRWIPPPRGVMEVNVDAALSKNSNKAAMAAVARDDVGNFLGASALLSRSSPEVAEAMAYREGLALATDLDGPQPAENQNCHGLRERGDEHSWPWYGSLRPHYQGDQGCNEKLRGGEFHPREQKV